MPSLLWEIRSDRSPLPSYLFGTVHLGLPAVFHRFDEACRYIASCEAFAAEYPLAELREEEVSAPPPPALSIEELLGARAFQRLRKALHRQYQFDLFPYRYLHPMLLSHLIDQQLMGAWYAATETLDYMLWTYAENAGKRMLGVETRAEQEGFIAQIPMAQHLRALKRLGRNLASERHFNHRLLQLYVQDDPTPLYQCARARSGQSRKPLILQRNQVMAERIADFANQAPTFCAIGAGHLGGGKGVLRLLKQRGFRLKPIFPEPIQTKNR